MFNSTKNKGWKISRDKSQLLAWLPPLEHGIPHRDIQERRVNQVGEWFMQTEGFRRWCGLGGEGEDDKSVLFCYGGPGVGKTFISSLVVDRLRKQASGPNTATMCFYFAFAARKEQSATSVLGSLLTQVVSGMERIPKRISRALEKGFYGDRPKQVNIVKILQLITSSQPTFMCIDALDECTGMERAKLLDSLNQILEESPGTRIFVTARPYIRVEIEKRLAGRVRSVSVGPTKEEIIRFLSIRLGEDRTPDAMDESLEADILEKLPGNISEMLLLGSLNIQTILQESTIHRRREKLSQMIDGFGLGDAYHATIDRIKAQDRDRSTLGMAALMWVSHAERPLRADELCHALAVEPGSGDFNSGNIPSVSTLVGCCHGLITVGKDPSTVRLIHFTLKEYLSSHPDIFIRPHSTMAEICLTYLNSQQVKTISTDTPPSTLGTPFLEYSSLYWGVHAKKELSDSARSLALELFQEYDGHISAKLLLGQPSYRLTHFEPDSRFSGLDCASFFGIADVVADLIERGCYDINEADFPGYTPLIWAAHNGHEEVVEILLRREEVNPDKPDSDNQTPLLHAARNGHEGVVKMLLTQQDVDPGQGGMGGGTPLWWAAGNGHEEVVKMLLELEEVDPGQPSYSGQTPLAHAALAGHETVVKTLLGRQEVNPNILDDCRRTPLWYATWNWHEGVVKMLLEREEINPDKPDNNGNTPLSNAARCGLVGVVRRLLGRAGVNPDKLDKCGRTPLSYAAWAGSEEVVKMLLGRGEVNPDKAAYDGRTPLAHAARKGHDGVVKILLGREEVDPDKPDHAGQTPLSYAARKGHEEVAKILLGRAEVNPDKPCNTGQAPLSYAAWGGYMGVVKMLLGRKEVNPDKPDQVGQTPLSHAAGKGHEEVVKILLGRAEVNPDKPDNTGRTPLSYAAWAGHEGVVKMLLGLEKVSPDKPDDCGNTPLMGAALRGYEGVVKTLLGRKEVDPDKQDDYGKTPLSVAAEYGHDGVVKILLGRGEVTPEKADARGRTPLMSARMRCHKRVIELLEPYEVVTPSGI